MVKFITSRSFNNIKKINSCLKHISAKRKVKKKIKNKKENYKEQSLNVEKTRNIKYIMNFWILRFKSINRLNIW